MVQLIPDTYSAPTAVWHKNSRMRAGSIPKKHLAFFLSFIFLLETLKGVVFTKHGHYSVLPVDTWLTTRGEKLMAIFASAEYAMLTDSILKIGRKM